MYDGVVSAADGRARRNSEIESEPGAPSGQGLRKDKKLQRVIRGGKETAAPKSVKGNANVSAENRRFILKVLQKHFVFGNLDDDEQETVVDHFEMQKVGTSSKVAASKSAWTTGRFGSFGVSTALANWPCFIACQEQLPSPAKRKEYFGKCMRISSEFVCTS